MERNYGKRRKWSDVVADKDPHGILKNLNSTQNTENAITPQPG
jgi:hypothetical protein